MSSIKLAPNASGTGEFTIAAPNSNTNRTFNLPDESGTVLVNGTNSNVGIGTSSPGARLDVAISNGGLVQQLTGTSGVYTRLGTSTTSFYTVHNGSTDTFLYTQESAALRFGTAATERARIDSNGRMLVNRTSAYSDGNIGNPLFQANNVVGASAAAAFITTTTANQGLVGFVNPNGTVGQIFVSGSSTSYNTSSDYRLKEDIAPMTGALAKIAALKPVTYKWKVDGSDGQGFIAHELAEVCPDAVTGEKDAVDAEGNPQYQGIDTSFLVATLTAAIQEQQAIIQQLTARIEALEAK